MNFCDRMWRVVSDDGCLGTKHKEAVQPRETSIAVAGSSFKSCTHIALPGYSSGRCCKTFYSSLAVIETQNFLSVVRIQDFLQGRSSL